MILPISAGTELFFFYDDFLMKL